MFQETKPRYFTKYYTRTPLACMEPYIMHKGDPKSMRGVYYGRDEEEAVANLIKYTSAVGCIVVDKSYVPSERSHYRQRGTFAYVWYDAAFTDNCELWVKHFMSDNPQHLTYVHTESHPERVAGYIDRVLLTTYPNGRYRLVTNFQKCENHILLDQQTGRHRIVDVGTHRAKMFGSHKQLPDGWEPKDYYSKGNWLMHTQAYTYYKKIPAMTDRVISVDGIKKSYVVSQEFSTWLYHNSLTERYSTSNLEVFLEFTEKISQYVKSKFFAAVDAGLLQVGGIPYGYDAGYDVVKLNPVVLREAIKKVGMLGRVPFARRHLAIAIDHAPSEVMNTDYGELKKHPLYRCFMTDRDHVIAYGKEKNAPWVVQDYDRIIRQAKERKRENARSVGSDG